MWQLLLLCIFIQVIKVIVIIWLNDEVDSLTAVYMHYSKLLKSMDFAFLEANIQKSAKNKF